MPKILDISYAGELGAANYILGIRDGKAVRFPIEVFEDEPIVNSSFTVLTDTPANYVDQAGKLAAVNSTETGLEFIDAPTSLPAGGAAGQVLTKNSATDGDASWAEASGGTEIISSLTAPSSPVDGQLWIDESQGVQDQTNFIDVTNASTDYPLRRGETAVVNYSEATSVPLNIKTVEGLYEVCIIGNMSFTAYGSATNYLYPNNSALIAGAVDYCRLGENIITASTGSNAIDNTYDGTTRTGITLGNSTVILAELKISTITSNKTCLSNIATKVSDTVRAHYVGLHQWADVATIWNSLGTISLFSAQSGQILIRRLY